MRPENDFSNNENSMEQLCFSDCSWIWLKQDEEEVNQYVQFRHEFVLDNMPSDSCRLYISSDTEYVLWLNDSFVEFGQYDDFPEHKVYDCIPVTHILKPGKNVLCVMVHYQGEDSSQYIKGKPGIIYFLDAGSTKVSSGTMTHCRRANEYTNGEIARITPQLSFTFEYNAIKADNWTAADYLMGKEWSHASVTHSRYFSWSKRPVHKLKIEERCPTRVISQGFFYRGKNETGTVAQLMQSDYLSFRNADTFFQPPFINTLPSCKGIRLKPLCITEGTGIYFIIDLGCEESGLFEMEIETEEDTVIDIAYGEHLDDLRVRAWVEGRNFASRYISCNNRQTFTHYFKRFAGRYIQLHVSRVKETFILHYAGLRPVIYPVEEIGEFNCPDSLHNRICDVSVRTLRLCMHEHYEDSPWREQALYAMDARNQALCGYYSFGEYDFPEASLELLGYGQRDDNYLQICAPSRLDFTIPSFSFTWIIGLYEHLLFSGRVEWVKIVLPQIIKMLNAFINTMRNGLFVTPVGEKYWHFYEWSEGLNGVISYSDGLEVLREERFDAPLNLFFCMALESAAKIAKACDDFQSYEYYSCVVNKLKEKIHSTFWNSKEKAYKDYSCDNDTYGFNELTQALALYAGVCPHDIAGSLRKRLSEKDNGMRKITLSHSIYKYEALMAEPHKYAQIVMESIEEKWGYMLLRGATSFWETLEGADDFGKAGSLCHGWSAIPIYFYYAYVLGIKPIEPGFKSFNVEPITYVFDKACGKVPTPYGIISVKWQKDGQKLKYEICNPEGTKMVMTDSVK